MNTEMFPYMFEAIEMGSWGIKNSEFPQRRYEKFPSFSKQTLKSISCKKTLAQRFNNKSFS